MPLCVGVSGTGQLLLMHRGWCLLWTAPVAVGVCHLWDSDPGCLQLDIKHQSNFGKSRVQLLPQGMWHWWLGGHQWWCWGWLNWNWANTFTSCLFSNGFHVLYGELHQIPQVPVEKAAAFHWKGGNFISHYVYTWNDGWDKDCWKKQSGINVLADKFAVSRESGGKFYLKQTKHTLKIAFTPFSQIRTITTHILLHLNVVICSHFTPCTFHVVIMYSCTGLVHHMTCNF